MTTTSTTKTYASLMKAAENATDRKTAIKLINEATKLQELSWSDLLGHK